MEAYGGVVRILPYSEDRSAVALFDRPVVLYRDRGAAPGVSAARPGTSGT